MVIKLGLNLSYAWLCHVSFAQFIFSFRDLSPEDEQENYGEDPVSDLMIQTKIRITIRRHPPDKREKNSLI